jgi:hypothetical protein
MPRDKVAERSASKISHEEPCLIGWSGRRSPYGNGTLVEGDDLALRDPARISRFAAVTETSMAGFASLWWRRLPPRDEVVPLMPDDVAPPVHLEVIGANGAT